jgi:hypothetical protein
MGKIRVFLSHHSGSIMLPQGETLIGRGLSCAIRFNDPGISREHARVVVTGTVVTVEDLGSTNGTRINSMPFVGLRELANGDELQIGHRWLKLRVLVGKEAEEFEEETQDHFTDEGLQAELEAQPVAPLSAKKLPKLGKQNCPRCREQLDAEASVCPKCRYRLPGGRPRSITQEIRVQDVDRRATPRHPVEIPLIYSSDTLTFDAMARDMSYGGMFIATELLDPLGTRCNIMILPDGAPPIAVSGVVCHVIEEQLGRGGRPPGIGIKFTEVAEDTQRWLKIYLAQRPVA